MKKATGIIAIIFLAVFLFSGAVVATDEIEKFGKAYEETEILTRDLFKGVSEAFEGSAMEVNKLTKLADKILRNTLTLEKTAEAEGKKDSASEARQMNSYMNRIKKTFKTGENKDELSMLMARYYLHYNNCIMLKTLNLKVMQKDHLEELKDVLSKNEIGEITQLAEHLHLHSDQMYYASYIFGIKIWQKFSSQVKELADEIFVAAQKNDLANIKAGIEKIEKPINMLGKLVKK